MKLLQQAFIWSNDDSVHWHIYVSIEHSNFNVYLSIFCLSVNSDPALLTQTIFKVAVSILWNFAALWGEKDFQKNVRSWAICLIQMLQLGLGKVLLKNWLPMPETSCHPFLLHPVKSIHVNKNLIQSLCCHIKNLPLYKPIIPSHGCNVCYLSNFCVLLGEIIGDSDPGHINQEGSNHRNTSGSLLQMSPFVQYLDEYWLCIDSNFQLWFANDFT